MIKKAFTIISFILISYWFHWNQWELHLLGLTFRTIRGSIIPFLDVVSLVNELSNMQRAGRQALMLNYSLCLFVCALHPCLLSVAEGRCLPTMSTLFTISLSCVLLLQSICIPSAAYKRKGIRPRLQAKPSIQPQEKACNMKLSAA